MRRFRKEFGLKKARILRERLIPVSQRLKIGINRHPLGNGREKMPDGFAEVRSQMEFLLKLYYNCYYNSYNNKRGRQYERLC